MNKKYILPFIILFGQASSYASQTDSNSVSDPRGVWHSSEDYITPGSPAAIHLEQWVEKQRRAHQHDGTMVNVYALVHATVYPSDESKSDNV